MEEKINTKIAEIKTTIKEITKHFNYDEEVINILTIVYLSMIMLDDEIEDLLMEVLSKTYILFTGPTHDSFWTANSETLHSWPAKPSVFSF